MSEQVAGILKDAGDWAKRELAPRAAEVETVGVSRKTLKEMGERGYLAATFPKRFGGLDLDAVAYGRLTESLGKHCPCTRAALTVQTSLVGECLLKWGTDDQINRYLPAMARGDKMTAFALTEPNIGTDAKHVEATYECSGDGYVIKGRKKWISFGAIADMYLTVARRGEEITAFLVDRDSPGLSVKAMTGLMGMRGCHLAEITYDSVEAGKRDVIGGVGNGFRYIANTALDHGRFSIAWGSVALCQSALEAMVSYARQRTQFGKKLHEHQLIQGLIGDSTVKTHAARALCMRAAEMRRDNDPESVMETAMAKYFASVVAGEVTRDAVQVHGGNGCSDLFPVERLFREAKIMEIIEGTSQIQQQIAARHAVQKYFQPDYAVNRERP